MINHGLCIKKIYDTDLGSVGINTRAIDKNFISVFFNFIIMQLTRASDKSN